MAGVNVEEEQKNKTRHDRAKHTRVPLGGPGHNEKINKDFLPKDPFSLQMSSTEVRKWQSSWGDFRRCNQFYNS